MVLEPSAFQQTVSQIAQSLKGMTSQQADAVLTQAKVMLFKSRPFEALTGLPLFERQVTRLIDRGYPGVMELSTPVFRELLDPLRKLIEDFYGGDIPFLIVMPPNLVSISDQLALIEYEGNGVTQFLKDEDLVNREGVSTPTQPYLVSKVEVGDQLLGISADSAFESLADSGRLPLTIAEGAALLTQYPQVLDFVNITVAGTLHQSNTAIDLYVYAGAVKLKRDPAHLGDLRWGVPSCESRLF